MNPGHPHASNFINSFFAPTMFPMDHHNHQYGYPQPGQPAQPAQPAQPPPPRQYVGHGTSSAFSSSANPDEDWTKISDLAERRRIQNRIAQRNYRKKLKRRLEDLERRAASPEGANNEMPTPPETKPTGRTRASGRRASQARAQRARSTEQEATARPMQMQYSPPLEASDMMSFPAFDERERSGTPPMYSYSGAPYSLPDEPMLNPYGGGQPYHGTAGPVDYQPYFAVQAMGAPTTDHFGDAMKKESFSSDGSMSQYQASYAVFPGMDVGMSATFDQSNPQTPPLSASFDQSAGCSESGYELPQTPLSMPSSPGYQNLEPQQMQMDPQQMQMDPLQMQQTLEHLENQQPQQPQQPQ